MINLIERHPHPEWFAWWLIYGVDIPTCLIDHGIEYDQIHMVSPGYHGHHDMMRVLVTDDESTTMLKLMSEME